MKRAKSKKTGFQLVREWADASGSRSDAAKKIVNGDGEALGTSHFVGWLNGDDRGLRPMWAQAIALAVGIPLEAVLFKNTPLKDLPCEKSRAKGRAA